MAKIHYRLANAVGGNPEILDDSGNVFNILQASSGGAFSADDATQPVLVANLDKSPLVYRAGGAVPSSGTGGD